MTLSCTVAESAVPAATVTLSIDSDAPFTMRPMKPPTSACSFAFVTFAVSAPELTPFVIASEMPLVLARPTNPPTVAMPTEPDV